MTRYTHRPVISLAEMNEALVDLVHSMRWRWDDRTSYTMSELWDRTVLLNGLRRQPLQTSSILSSVSISRSKSCTKPSGSQAQRFQHYTCTISCCTGRSPYSEKQHRKKLIHHR